MSLLQMASFIGQPRYYDIIYITNSFNAAKAFLSRRIFLIDNACCSYDKNNTI